MTLVSTYASNFDKPNRLDEVKDKDYHVRYGKFALANANSKWQMPLKILW